MVAPNMTNPMNDSVDRYIISGRSAGVTGHGIERWTLSCRAMAEGRGPIAGIPGFEGRPTLTREILPALRGIAANPMDRASMKSLISNVIPFWKFFDETEEASRANGTQFVAPGSVLEVPGLIWALFKDWLDAQAVTVQHFQYSQTKRVFDAAAQLILRKDYNA